MRNRLSNREWASLSDAALVESARSGNPDAFAILWTRHSAAALRAARQFSSTADPDDLVSEAYARIFAAVRNGKGPSGAFRPYLFVTIRNLATRIARSSHEDTVEDLESVYPTETAVDPLIAALDRTLTVRAFRTLPERWQTVLWYTAIEGLTPLEASGMLGLSANSTAALALRARKGLRHAWIQAHVNDESSSPECKWMLANMAGFARGRLSERDRQRATLHLAGCAKCLIVSEEVDDVSSHLAMVVIPLVLGGAAGTGYLASLHGSIPPASGQASASTSSSGSLTTAGGSTSWLVGVGVAVVVTAAVSWGALALIHSPPPPHRDVAIPAQTILPDAPAKSEPLPPSPATEPPPVTMDPAPVVLNPAEPKPSPAPPPTVPALVLPPAISTPSDGALLATSTPMIGGTGEPGNTVRIVADGAALGTTVVDGAGEWSLTPSTPLDDGEHELSARQSDGTAQSAAVTVHFTTDTVALAPTVASTPDPSGTTAPFLDGSAEPHATITVTDQDGIAICTVTADADGRWNTGPMTELDPAATSLSVVQRDLAGNVSTATVIGPLAFQPVLLSPTTTAEAQLGVPFAFEVGGWAGARLAIELDGEEFSGPWAFDDTGRQTRSATFGSAGTHIVGFRYLGASVATTVRFEVTVIPAAP